MNTPTHMVIAAALRRALLNRRGTPGAGTDGRLRPDSGTPGAGPAQGADTPAARDIPLSALLWGSFAPDAAIFLLSIGAWVYYVPILGWTSGEAFAYMWGELFYTNPWWIVTHNLLQAPLILLVATAALALARHHTAGSRGGTVSRGGTLSRGLDWWFYFVLACGVHTLIDIPTHHNDGPLLLFPFDWELRYSSPVSYWDPDHYGLIFMPLEGALLIALSVYLLRGRRRRQHRSAAGSARGNRGARE